MVKFNLKWHQYDLYPVPKQVTYDSQGGPFPFCISLTSAVNHPSKDRSNSLSGGDKDNKKEKDSSDIYIKEYGSSGQCDTCQEGDQKTHKAHCKYLAIEDCCNPPIECEPLYNWAMLKETSFSEDVPR